MKIAISAVALAASLALAGAASAQGAQGGGGMSATRQACQADMQKLCSGVQPGGGRIMECFNQHKDELSAACKAAVADVEQRHAAKSGGGGGGRPTPAPN